MNLKEVPIKVYNVRYPEEWKLATGPWYPSSETIVWGLSYYGALTQMCYDIKSSPPREAIEQRQSNNEKDPNPDWLLWYFDVGNRIYVILDDLEKACKELGIWND